MVNFNLIPTPYKILAIFLFILGVCAFGYWEGGRVAKAEADSKIKSLTIQNQNLSMKITEAEGKVVVKVETQYVDRVKTVKETQYVYIKQAENDVPKQYVLSNGWVFRHDQAAASLYSGGEKIDTTSITDATPSGIADNQALATIVENYGRCKQNSEELKSLHQYILEYNAQIDLINGKKGGL